MTALTKLKLVNAQADQKTPIAIRRTKLTGKVDLQIALAKAQTEGAIVFGLSLALMGEISYQEGKVMQSNFHDYPLLRLPQVPEMEIIIINSDAPPAGVGEPGVPPVAPSLTNAIFAATGLRIRDLPVNKQLKV
mgnify:CR=1 FL=1